MAYRAQRAHHPYEEIEYDESPYGSRPGPSRNGGYQQREEQTYDYLPIQRPAHRSVQVTGEGQWPMTGQEGIQPVRTRRYQH